MTQPLPQPIFSLRKDSRNKTTNECAVYIQYCINRRTVRFDTGLTCSLKFWDKTNRRFTRKHPNHKICNARLREIKADHDQRLLEAASSEPWTIERVRDIICPKRVEEKTREASDFVYLTREVMEKEYRSGRIGISVLDNAICSLNMFNKFAKKRLGKEVIAPSELTDGLIDDYIVWRKEERGNANETINKCLTPIYKGVKVAMARGFITYEMASLIQSKYLAPQKQELSATKPIEEVRYLTEEQLRQFIDLYHSTQHPRTRDYMEMFLFSFHACGLRFSDCMTLQWSNVDFEKMEINKILVKGNVSHTVPLTAAAAEILNRWKGRIGSERFCFGLLPQKFDLNNARELKRMRINKNTAIKTSLHAIGRKLDLPFNLSFHCARHTFAVLSLNSGRLSVHAISRLLAHISILVTEKVYAKYLPSRLKAEVGTDMFSEFSC